MIIKSISLKNFKSFGNNKQTVSFNTTTGDLILLSGKNGAGKCLSPDTEIEIQIDDKETQKLLIKFLENRNKPL
jgi:predicted ATP-binding protein involved in virulence